MVVPRILAVTGTVALLSLAGCGAVLAQRRLDYSDTEEVKITKVTVAPGSGDVVVRTAAVGRVEIKRVMRYRGDEPTGATYRIEGTTLFIDTDCGRQCGVSYDILAPEGVSVAGHNGSGDVELSGVGDVDIQVGSGRIEITGAAGAVRAETGSGQIEISDAAATVRAETGSGDITVAGARGAVTARTGSGEVTGRRLSGGVDTETGSGEISLDLDAAASVRARAESGSVKLAVPAGSYRVRVATGSGGKRIDVADDPSATMLLDVNTGSGDVTIRQS